MKTKQYVELIQTHAWASIRAESKQTFIGYLWWLLDPMMFIGVYYLVFGVILKSKTEDFIVFLIIGILSFQWFQASIMQGSATINNAGGLIKRIRLPKTIFPFSKIVHNLWQFLFVFMVYSIVIYGVFGKPMSLHITATALVMLVQLLVITGIVLILSSLYPFFPDIKHFIQPILRALLFVSGVFFPADKVPEDLRFYFYLNPMACLIDGYRDSMLRNEWPDFQSLSLLAIVSIMMIFIGVKLINKFDSEYAKVIP